ncbi:nucleotidyltransferase domain-containing protein [Agrobacterium tumefaciens]|uniref:nucleotidyltransferase domain-containing protein n=1 Tax=Agrobacterium tumefaciens TaxID=358 RepID=UPI002787FA78|nr:nucleotidyltransferase [Agrobacterium tumefaciens]MDP9789293.1 hypothetical protein [Agrobacterium tumefaciens]
MPTTVPAAFDLLHSWLVPTAGETQTAASHRASIEACLKNNFGMTSFFRSGSFGHGTSIRTVSDVDYMAIIPPSNLADNSSTALENVKSALVRRFPNTNVHIRNPAVVVPFGTGPAERHEITPGYYLEKAGGYNVYGISNRAGSWMRTSPTAHGAWINDINDNLSKKLKPLIRFMKLWNFKRSGGIRSFYLELRTGEYARGENTIVYSIDMLASLRYLRNKGLAQMQDPMGIAGYIPACSDAVKQDALSKLDTAISRAEKARDAEKDGRISQAFDYWKLVFDGYFPNYG